MAAELETHAAAGDAGKRKGPTPSRPAARRGRDTARVAAAGMAWLCRAGTKGGAAPAFGRWLRNELWARPWNREGACPPWLFGTGERLQSGSRRVSGAAGGTGRQREPLPRLCHPAPATAVPPKAVEEERGEFRLVYRFPGIKYCRVLSRLKLLQTATTAVMLPPVFYLYLHGQVSQNILLYTTGIALFAGAMLYSMSYFFRRIIGLIYLNESGRTVRVAHLTFWGRRNDVYCPIETVVPLDEVGDSKGELLLQFKQYNSTDVLYFTVKYGQIVDRQKFTQIFGEFK